jgi:isoaspartyl peptidase/L-asparaginase-like protein (Ntn-hydrolase superfamily)
MDASIMNGKDISAGSVRGDKRSNKSYKINKIYYGSY